ESSHLGFRGWRRRGLERQHPGRLPRRHGAAKRRRSQRRRRLPDGEQWLTGHGPRWRRRWRRGRGAGRVRWRPGAWRARRAGGGGGGGFGGGGGGGSDGSLSNGDGGPAGFGGGQGTGGTGSVGFAVPGNGGGGAGMGGAVFSEQGTVSVFDSTFYDNSVTGG